MVSTISATRTVRLTNELWAWLAAEAERRESTVNALIGDLLLVAKLKAEEAKAAPVVKAAASKAVAKGVVSTPEGAPKQSAGFTPRADTYPAWMKGKRP